jgi:stage II sporulation protein R
MKILVSFCAAVLCAAVLISCFPIRGEEKIYDSMIRLHVLAESDSDEDQARKLRVRDAVLDVLAQRMEEAHSYEDAAAAVLSVMTEIEDAARRAVRGECTVRAEMGRERYPVRVYENYTLPAGEYTSLRVILGEGEGMNWWCVLFPQLCTAQASESEFYEDFIAAGFTPEQYRLIKNESGVQYRIRFRILEIFAQWIGMEY